MGSDAAVGDTHPAAKAVRVAAFVGVVSAFAGYLIVFGYRDELAENDLYRTLLGLLNGAATGRYLLDPLHYGKNFGFGYIELIYALVPLADLADRDAVVGVINGVGRVCAVVALVCIMAALRSVYGGRAALVGGIVFGFSPVVLDLAPSGHQLLPALACFGAAAVAMLADTRGWRRLAAYTAGSGLLFVGMTMRAELPLAFPWLVLAQRSPATSGDFAATAFQRCAACLAAFGAFYALRHALFPVPEPGDGNLGGLGSLVATFFRFQNLGPGVVALVLGCGLATVLAAAVASVAEAARLRRAGRVAAWMIRSPLLAPFVLVATGLLFWLPNPYPARHFTFVCLGLAAIVGIAAARRLRLGPAVAVGVAIVAANQLASEAARPFVLSRLHSPYTDFPDDRRTLTAAPLGFSWRHSRTIQHRRAAFTRLGRALGTTCEPKLLVVSDQALHLAGTLYRPGEAIVTDPITVGPYAGLDVSRPGRRAVYLPVAEGWPADPMPVLLRDEGVHDHKIARDPYSRSIHDKTPVPEDRRADLDGAPGGAACRPAVPASPAR